MTASSAVSNASNRPACGGIWMCAFARGLQDNCYWQPKDRYSTWWWACMAHIAGMTTKAMRQTPPKACSSHIGVKARRIQDGVLCPMELADAGLQLLVQVLHHTRHVHVRLCVHQTPSLECLERAGGPARAQPQSCWCTNARTPRRVRGRNRPPTCPPPTHTHLRAADEAHRRQPKAVGLDGLHRRRCHLRVMGQAQVVVGAGAGGG